VASVAVDHCRRDLGTVTQAAVDLARRAVSLHWDDGTGHLERVGVRRVESIAELAMLRMQLGWETFLEDVFLRYMCGARTAAGFSPILLQPRERTIAGALQTLLGGQLFLNWSIVNTLNRAAVQFDASAPFALSLAAVRTTVVEMNTIRNRIAHSSEFSRNEFRAVVRNHLGYVPRGMSPGRFLLTTIPGSGTPGTRFIEDFGLKLLGAGALIVP
jgi:hypothetical protein